MYARLGSIIALLSCLAISAYAGHWITNAHWSAKWVERDKADLSAQLIADQRELKLQTDWQNKIDEVAQNAKLEQAKISADAAELSDTVAELRRTIKVSDSNLQSTAATITRLRAANATTKLVQSELSSWCIGRIEIMAGIIDRSRAAGLACEKSYNAIRLDPVLQ